MSFQRLFDSYERPSPIGRLNPAVKLVIVLLFMVCATLLFDIALLLALFVVGALAAMALGRVPPGAFLRGLLPFVLFGLGYLWMNALFPRETAVEILFRLGPLRFAREGVFTGLALGARALCFGAYSILFVGTTDPMDFTVSLVRQLRISPRIAYSALAALRYLPILRSELDQIRAAHRLRGVGEGRRLRGALTRVYRYTIPLMAGAFRRAGRVAMAMEARGFGGGERSSYRDVRPGRADALFAAAAAAVLVAVLLLAFGRGAGLWRGQLWG